MKVFHLGRLSDSLSPKTVALLCMAAAFVIIFLSYKALSETSAGCVRCHSDKSRMEKLNVSWAYVTNETVRKESRHKTIECRDCHLGNGRSDDENIAHRGMLKMLIVSDGAKLLNRKEGYPYGLSRTGDDKLDAFLPKKDANGRWVPLAVRNILWHDRNPATFDFDPEVIAKTCGKSGCHPEELKQFNSSDMGKNFRQRKMKTWLTPYGPHNCGPSFADKGPSKTNTGPGFDYSNTRVIAEELNLPFSAEQARDKQKFCNVCHAGCLDCHYTPLPAVKKGETGGVHSFTKVPNAESCSGYGRSNSICHPGAMHSRRGETYIGGDYSVPEGMRPDVHYKKGFGCVACHKTGEGGMAHMERKASCEDCHIEVEEAIATDPHKNMDCATCHISELRGYQITAWGPGIVAGKNNPFNKYSLYYGTQAPPIIIRDQKGKWMPVKIWPHSVANIKPEVRPSKGIEFRWPGGETRDAYFVLGTFSVPQNERIGKTNNKHLLWLEIEQAAHPYGPSRSCASCHDSSGQSSISKWKYEDDQGASEPFTGGYTIRADEKGIRIEGMETTSPIKLMPGYSLTDFAPWIFLKDKWEMPGDFSIKADGLKYKSYRQAAKQLDEKIKSLDRRSAAFDHKAALRYREARSFARHNPMAGLQRLKKEFP